MAWQICCFEQGPLAVNTYLLYSQSGNHCVVIDPAWDWQEIEEAISARNLTLAAVLLTHSHCDHITGLHEKRERLQDIPVFLHPDDHFLYGNKLNWLPGFPLLSDLPPLVTQLPPAAHKLGGGLKLLHTPGHSPGSCVFYFEAWKLAFTGDTLFAGSVGRTDLWGGSMEELNQSIRNQLLSLPDDVMIYAGHGPSSTIGDERRWNPFLKF